MGEKPRYSAVSGGLRYAKYPPAGESLRIAREDFYARFACPSGKPASKVPWEALNGAKTAKNPNLHKTLSTPPNFDLFWYPR